MKIADNNMKLYKCLYRGHEQYNTLDDHVTCEECGAYEWEKIQENLNVKKNK